MLLDLEDRRGPSFLRRCRGSAEVARRRGWTPVPAPSERESSVAYETIDGRGGDCECKVSSLGSAIRSDKVCVEMSDMDIGADVHHGRIR